MRICIDARWVGEKIAGIGRYTVYLMKYLAELDPGHDYLVLFHNGSVRDRVCGELGLSRRRNWAVRTVPYDVFSLRGQWFLPRMLRRERVDLFHSTNFMAPLMRYGGKLVLTVHDIIPLKFPEYAPRSKKTRLFPVYRAIMKRLARIADLIIADSEHSRGDIINFLDVPPDRVRTVYLGVDPKYRQLGPGIRERVRKTLGIRDKLALYAGRADPYKNLISLIKAAREINKKGKLHCTVVVAGEKDRRYPEVDDYLRGAGVEADVLFLGNLDEDELIPLYNAADALVLPSLYEGFGLPPLEAMACGVPVVCSNRASLPEVVGDAAILVEPMDVRAIADAMERVCTDSALRKKMIAAGLERAKGFPWRNTAEGTLAIYNELLAGRVSIQCKY
ncbi:MAG: glycosyltransferase family 1 protein [Candidatus Aureabacteria bacterium]|nr:glycosyltransferase family 1 protein [Candidatus Auribacterota bacterium]